MSHWRRTVFVVIGLAQVAFLVVFLNTAGAEIIGVAESMEFVRNGPFWDALQRIEYVGYALIVPVFIIDLVLYQLIGPVQDERERKQVPTRGRY